MSMLPIPQRRPRTGDSYDDYVRGGMPTDEELADLSSRFPSSAQPQGDPIDLSGRKPNPVSIDPNAGGGRAGQGGLLMDVDAPAQPMPHQDISRAYGGMESGMMGGMGGGLSLLNGLRPQPMKPAQMQRHALLQLMMKGGR